MLPIIFLILLGQICYADVGGVDFSFSNDQAMRSPVITVPEFHSEKDARKWARSYGFIEPVRRALNKQIRFYEDFAKTNPYGNNKLDQKWIDIIRFNHMQAKFCTAALEEISKFDSAMVFIPQEFANKEDARMWADIARADAGMPRKLKKRMVDLFLRAEAVKHSDKLRYGLIMYQYECFQVALEYVQNVGSMVEWGVIPLNGGNFRKGIM